MTDQASLATFSDLLGRLKPSSQTQIATVKAQVATYATDAADQRLLLDMLGIGDAA